MRGVPWTLEVFCDFERHPGGIGGSQRPKAQMAVISLPGTAARKVWGGVGCAGVVWVHNASPGPSSHTPHQNEPGLRGKLHGWVQNGEVGAWLDVLKICIWWLKEGKNLGRHAQVSGLALGSFG